MESQAQISRQEFEILKKEVDFIEETLEVLMDKELIEGMKRGKKDIQEGRVYTSDEAEKEIFDNQ